MRALIFIAAASILANGPAIAQSLKEQKICAAQARKAFEEDSHKWDLQNKGCIKTFSFDYQSHYNVKLNRCLIPTTRTAEIVAGQFSTTKFLYDAFEGRGYAEFLWTSHAGKKYWDVRPTVCLLTPHYGQKKHCKTEAEFDAFVAKYMEQ